MLSPAWLEKCRAQKQWLCGDDLSAYFLDADQFCGTLLASDDEAGFADVKTRALSDNPPPPVFKGMEFYRDSSFPIKHDELKGLIDCAGAQLLKQNQSPKAGANIKFEVL
jgi:hypothetical protein